MRMRLTLTFTAAVALFLLGADAALIGYTCHAAQVRSYRALHHSLDRAEDTLTGDEDEVLEHDPSAAGAPPGALAVEAVRLARGAPGDPAEDVAIVVTDARSGQTWRSGRDFGGTLPEAQPLAEGGGWHIRRQRIAAPGADGKPTEYVVTVGIPWARVTAALTAQAALLLALSLLVVLLVAGGTSVLVGRTLRPIDDLARQAAQDATAAPPDRLRLSAPSRDAEVVRLVGTLNGLLDRIAESAAQKGRFYAAASHELRTPLHVLAGQTELALSRTRTAAEYRDALVDVQAQAERLVSLVQSLLVLNRLERFPSETLGEPVDIAALCRRLHAQFAPQMAARGLHVTMELPTDAGAATIQAPAEHVEILLRNLFENAARYTRPEGAVRLCLAPEGSDRWLRFDLFNECPPFEINNMDQLFEPFFRPDASRSSRTGGNGLGLSLCKALAEANGWRLTLRQEAGGVRAVVLFGEGAAA